MQFTKEIFRRANIRGLTDYLLCGIPPYKGEKDYDVRLDEAYQKYEAVVLRYDQNPDSELLDYANKLVDETMNVYTEIGIQAGFLIVQDMIENIGLLPDVAEEGSVGVNYRKMYELLFRAILDALEFLQKSDEEIACRAENILKEAQCQAEQIYIESEK